VQSHAAELERRRDAIGAQWLEKILQSFESGFICGWIGFFNDLFYDRSYIAGLGELSISVCA